MIELCFDKVNIFINNTFKTNKINIKLNEINEESLAKLSYNKLKIVLKSIKNIPINICDSIDFINKIEKLDSANKFKYKQCQESLQSFIDYQIKLLDINSNYLTNYTLAELKNIYNISKYLNISNFKCQDLKRNDNFIDKIRKDYHNKLVTKIENHVSQAKQRKCYSKN